MKSFPVRGSIGILTSSCLVVLPWVGGCSGSDSSSGPPGDTGGSAELGGTSSLPSGGANSAGANAMGGNAAGGTTGGSKSSGGAPAIGGASSNSIGGAETTGGANSIGGSPVAGGTTGAGGTKAVATGGVIGLGGVTSSGGAKGMGGTTGGGGAVSTGGSKVVGGTAATGGMASTGGNKATGGGAATGGAKATGGNMGTGGATSSTSPCSESPIGWATQGGTIGGFSGSGTTVTTCAALKSAVSQSGSAIVMVSGSITCDDVRVSSNKCIVGNKGAAIISPSGSTNHLLAFNGVNNVIVRNLVLQGAGVTSGNKSAGDVFHVESNAHHIWADHLDISDGDDGNLDITLGSDFITVSWTKFHYTSASRAHRFSDLIAAALGDTGSYRITWHHNWWATNVDQRSPRAHEGKGGIHLFNNYYSEAGNSYCVGVGQNAIFLSENNYFDGVNVPFYMTPNGETGGQILSKGDVFHNTTGNTTGTNTGFTPPYPYTLDPTANVPTLVQSGAGATM